MFCSLPCLMKTHISQTVECTMCASRRHKLLTDAYSLDLQQSNRGGVLPIILIAQMGTLRHRAGEGWFKVTWLGSGCWLQGTVPNHWDMTSHSLKGVDKDLLNGYTHQRDD